MTDSKPSSSKGRAAATPRAGSRAKPAATPLRRARSKADSADEPQAKAPASKAVRKSASAAPGARAAKAAGKKVATTRAASSKAEPEPPTAKRASASTASKATASKAKATAKTSTKASASKRATASADEAESAAPKTSSATKSAAAGKSTAASKAAASSKSSAATKASAASRSAASAKSPEVKVPEAKATAGKTAAGKAAEEPVSSRGLRGAKAAGLNGTAQAAESVEPARKPLARRTTGVGRAASDVEAAEAGPVSLPRSAAAGPRGSRSGLGRTPVAVPFPEVPFPEEDSDLRESDGKNSARAARSADLTGELDADDFEEALESRAPQAALEAVGSRRGAPRQTAMAARSSGESGDAEPRRPRSPAPGGAARPGRRASGDPAPSSSARPARGGGDEGLARGGSVGGPPGPVQVDLPFDPDDEAFGSEAQAAPSAGPQTRSGRGSWSKAANREQTPPARNAEENADDNGAANTGEGSSWRHNRAAAGADRPKRKWRETVAREEQPSAPPQPASGAARPSAEASPSKQGEPAPAAPRAAWRRSAPAEAQPAAAEPQTEAEKAEADRRAKARAAAASLGGLRTGKSAWRQKEGPAARPAPATQAEAEAPAAHKPKSNTECEGLLVIDQGGHGKLRQKKNQYLSDKLEDVHVVPRLIQKCGLREGAIVRGRPMKGLGKHKWDLADVYDVDGLSIEEAKRLPEFRRLTSIDPDFHYALGDQTDDVSLRVIDLICPIGRGSRGLIVAPPRTGKTILMQKIAKGIEEHYPEVHLIVLLVDERPEEATEWRRTTKGEVLVSTNDEMPRVHVELAEAAWARATRLVELGKDVVLLLDSITRLARAYNHVAGNSGKTMSGGLDSRAMERPKQFFGSARNTEAAGSLTMLGTTLIETGSLMDKLIFEEFKGTGNMELVLSRKLADRRIFPAIDVERSGTRKEEKLMSAQRLKRITTLRRVLARMHFTEAMELLITRLENVEKNDDFLKRFDVDPEA